jgi:integrase
MPARKRGRGEGCVYRKGDAWAIKYYEGGKARYKSSKKWSKANAQEELRKRLGRMDRGLSSGADYEKTTLKDLAELAVKDYELKQRKSLETLLYRIDNLLLYFGENTKAKDIKEKSIEDYILARRKNPKRLFKKVVGSRKRNGEKTIKDGGPVKAKDPTIIRELRALSLMYRLGVEKDMVGKNLRIPKLKESKPKQGFPEKEDYQGLKKNLPDHLKPVVTVAWMTGWRKSEILGLQWKNISWLNKNRTRGKITLMDAKNDEPRSIFMDKIVLSVIKKQLQLRKSGSGKKTKHVFHRNGKPIKDFRRAWKNAAKAIGRPKLTFHDFRRAAARNLVDLRIPEKDIMLIGGWKTRSVFDRYNIRNEKSLERAAEIISAANAR